MDLPDSDLFVFEFPVWFIAVIIGNRQPAAISLRDPDVGLLRATDAETGESAFGLFTDEDLAERFASAMGLTRWSLGRIETRLSLIKFLADAVARGCTRVLIDPVFGSNACQKHSIPQVIDVLTSADG